MRWTAIISKRERRVASCICCGRVSNVDFEKAALLWRLQRCRLKTNRQPPGI